MEFETVTVCRVVGSPVCNVVVSTVCSVDDSGVWLDADSGVETELEAERALLGRGQEPPSCRLSNSRNFAQSFSFTSVCSGDGSARFILPLATSVEATGVGATGEGDGGGGSGTTWFGKACQ